MTGNHKNPYINNMRKRSTPKKTRARTDTSSKAKKTTKKKAKAKVAKISRVPKTRNAGTWSESQFWGSIRAALRSKSRFWKPRLQVLEEARRPNQSSNRRLKWEFLCAHCKNWFPQTQVEVNHKVEAGSLKSAADLAGFVERLFCEKSGLECLCKPCHREHHEKEKQEDKAA
jgi:hypothetical protein